MELDPIRPDRRDRRFAVAALVLVIATMAIDHLLGDDPGLEDPVTFAISIALCLILLAIVFGRIVPSAKRDPARAGRTSLI